VCRGYPASAKLHRKQRHQRIPAYLNITGDIDIAGRLRATLAKNRALLEAAHAGTEVAKRALAQAVIDAYYGLALATAQRGAAEQNLLAAEEFERITSLLLSGARWPQLI